MIHAIAPIAVPATLLRSGRVIASTVRFIYMEHIPYRCVASSMQLFYFPSKGVADFRSSTHPEHVWDSHAAPTGDPVRIRPGDILMVSNHAFEVHVTEGSGQIFPDLHSIEAQVPA